MPPIRPNRSVQEARQRRTQTEARRSKRTEWFIEEVSQRIDLTMKQRVELATDYLKTKVVENIKKPVRKGIGSRSGRTVVTERSDPGEFPRADTTQLMKTIFSDVRKSWFGGQINGHVGTPLDYGLILETRLNRSFLIRTLREEEDKIRKILTRPMK